MTVERFQKYAQREGIAIGLAEGAQQKALETAKNLLALNILTLNQIASTTGLSLEQVKELSSTVLGNK